MEEAGQSREAGPVATTADGACCSLVGDLECGVLEGECWIVLDARGVYEK